MDNTYEEQLTCNNELHDMDSVNKNQSELCTDIQLNTKSEPNNPNEQNLTELIISNENGDSNANDVLLENSELTKNEKEIVPNSKNSDEPLKTGNAFSDSAKSLNENSKFVQVQKDNQLSRTEILSTNNKVNEKTGDNQSRQGKVERHCENSNNDSSSVPIENISPKVVPDPTAKKKTKYVSIGLLKFDEPLKVYINTNNELDWKNWIRTLTISENQIPDEDFKNKLLKFNDEKLLKVEFLDQESKSIDGITINKSNFVCSQLRNINVRIRLFFNFSNVQSEIEKIYFLDICRRLIATNDPRSLWLDKPIPTDIEYKKPNESASFVENKFCKKNIIAASKRGRSHAHSALPRDDDYGIKVCEKTGWSILVVADGAGSAKFSREGSRIACEEVVNYCYNVLDDENSDFNLCINKLDNANSDISKDLKVQIKKKSYDLLPKSAQIALKRIEETSKNTGLS